MKRVLIATGIVLLLAACGDEEPQEEEGWEQDQSEEEVDSEQETNGDETDGESDSAEEASSIDSAADVIAEAQNLHGDVISHEVVLSTTMSIGEEVTESTSSTMIDEDQNLQLQFTDSDGNVVSHYYLADGNSFTHRNDEFTDLDAEITNGNATYGDLLSTLDRFSDAELTNSTDGYTIVSQIEEIGDLSAFLDENDIALFEERAGDVTGEVEVVFNSDFVYTGATLNITITTEESDISIQSDIEVLNVGNIDFIVLPEGAPSELSGQDGAMEETDDTTDEGADEGTEENTEDVGTEEDLETEGE